MINLENNSISLDLFHCILKEIKNRPEHTVDIIDSFSKNQFKSKGKLLELIDKLNLNSDSEVVIFGCWYGSILIPVLANKFKRITGIDLNSDVIGSARSNLFRNYKNVDFIVDNVFLRVMERYVTTNLVINTSCEHMPSMKEWPWWDSINDGYFAFQSNNMFGIDGHTNCVNSIDEFKEQLPSTFQVLFEDELEDDRGARYTLVGKII